MALIFEAVERTIGVEGEAAMVVPFLGHAKSSSGCSEGTSPPALELHGGALVSTDASSGALDRREIPSRGGNPRDEPCVPRLIPSSP
jgi:hypothetical protein